MATAALPAARWPTPLMWLRDFLKEELAPYPGRGAVVTRMVIAATVVMLFIMTFRMPYGGYAALFALTIPRESADATLKAVKTMCFWFAVAAAYVLVGAIFFSGEPTLRLVWVMATLFLVFFALSAATNHTAALRFGYLVVIIVPLWDAYIPAEQKVTGTLWAVGTLSLGSIVTAVIEFIYVRAKHVDDLTTSLVDCLERTASLLRSWSRGVADSAGEQELARLTILGTSRMRRDLLLSPNDSPEGKQQMGAVISLVGRLVDVAANLSYFSAHIPDADCPRFARLADRIEALAKDLLGRRVARRLEVPAQTEPAGTVPLLLEMEQTVSLIAEALSGSDVGIAFGLPPATTKPERRLFARDALSNPDHIRFALRGSLAALLCYLTYNLVAWPGISTALTTCMLTALTTVGASRQKQVLRISGAIIGGVVLGFGAQIFILPAVDSIAGFLVVFLAVTIPAAWIITSGPRLSYMGTQIAIAFYLINLQEFKFQTSLAVARDRVVGILLGLFVMWLVFDRLWEASATVEIRRTFVSTLRLLARLMREPVAVDLHTALEQSSRLRETVNSNLEKLRQHADAMMLEFGPSRTQDLEFRRQILEWALQLRIMFITRIALLKYRLRLPGFHLPESILSTQETFDGQLAERLGVMADRLEGKAISNEQALEPLLGSLETAVHDLSANEPPSLSATLLRSFLPLCRRIESLVSTLEQEIRQAI